MSNYLREVKDLTDSKHRVMRNVVNAIETNSRKPKHKWRYVLISAILTIGATLFVLNEILIENEPQPATEINKVTEVLLDLEQPTFTEDKGLFYLHGVTLGDSQSRVIELLGENYKIQQEDGSGADFVMVYDELARFYFYEDKLDWILLKKVDMHYFDQLFKDYAGFKFKTTTDVNNDRFFYSKETGQLLKATTNVPNEDLYLYLIRGGKDLLENPDFPKWEQIIN